MDISNLATQDKEEEGKWFRVELYGEMQNLWLNILGGDSDPVHRHQRKQFKKMNSESGKNSKLSDTALDELLKGDIEGVIVRINGIAGGEDKPNLKEPVVLLGQTLGNDYESKRFLLEKIPALKKWVNEKSNERSNFLESVKMD